MEPDTGTTATQRPASRRILVGAAWTLLALAVIAAAMLAGITWASRGDRPPSDDARALDAALAAAGPVAAQDDAYAALLALADVGRSPTEGGNPGSHPDTDMPSRQDPQVDAAIAACEKPERGCIGALAGAEPALEAWIAKRQPLLDAYRALLPRRGWYEPLPPTVDPMRWHPPSLGQAMEAQRLHLAQALLDARAGRADAVRDALETDMRFWRSALAGSRMLISRMIAAKAVLRNLQMGTHVLARLPAKHAEAAIPSSWREPITRAERALLLPLAWEWAFSSAVLRDSYAKAERENHARGLSERAMRPLFKLQDTINRSATRMRRIAAAHDVPHARLRDSLSRYRSELNEESDFPFDLYNPLGRILDGIAAPGYTDYGGRLADLEAFRRAALAAAELRIAGVEPHGIAPALAVGPWREPYADSAFAWDEARACIGFEGLGTGWPQCLQPGYGEDEATSTATVTEFVR